MRLAFEIQSPLIFISGLSFFDMPQKQNATRSEWRFESCQISTEF